MSKEPEPESPAPFEPYVRPDEQVRELTWSAVLLGAVLGIVFGASSLYLFLLVGMTVSASIPVAVLSITIFRALSAALRTRRATILENNVVQTTGSAGESIAFGVGATMPALLILGYDMDPYRVMTVSVLGGVLGILMMIPLRRAFIVKQHGELKYPEGTACAKILVAGERGGASARTVFAGFGVAFTYQGLMELLGLWGKEIVRPITGITGYAKANLACEASPALLGVGYIIGPRVASVMVGGGLLTSLVLIPAIAYFGQSAPAPIAPADSATIAEMGPGDINRSYVRYIGAGAVAAGGIISMIRALPLIFSSLAGSLGSLRGSRVADVEGRTGRDMPLWLVGLGVLALVGAIGLSDLIPTNTAGKVAGASMIVVFGFLFVTVSSRLTGEIGSSSNPISGMTIAALLMTCLIFYLLGWVGVEYRVAALSVAAVVCIASSNGGTTSQDLKTGYLVGATPSKQQAAIVVGAITSAVVIGFILIFLNRVFTDVTSEAKYLPSAAAPVAEITETAVGPDDKTYKVWRLTKNIEGAQRGRYLVDPASGRAAFLVDPGLGGVVQKRADGTDATKFNPPQPALFATIIDGILEGDLPWVLVILGAMLSIIMYLAGISPLAFAVGVYLPLATTFPIFLGGLARAVIDRIHRLSEAESDASPAVLMSSGLIAGGSIAGILIAGLAGLTQSLGKDPNQNALTDYYYSTDALPTGTADPASLEPDPRIGPDGLSYRVWDLAAPVDEAEAGTYLVDDRGRATYRSVTGSSLDLSKRLGWSRTWHENPIPSSIAFGILVLILLGVGLKMPRMALDGSLPDEQGKARGEIDA